MTFRTGNLHFGITEQILSHNHDSKIRVAYPDFFQLSKASETARATKGNRHSPGMQASSWHKERPMATHRGACTLAGEKSTDVRGADIPAHV